MDENDVAGTVAEVLKWSSNQAESPAFIEIASEENEIRLTAVPGRRFRLVVEEI